MENHNTKHHDALASIVLSGKHPEVETDETMAEKIKAYTTEHNVNVDDFITRNEDIEDFDPEPIESFENNPTLTTKQIKKFQTLLLKRKNKPSASPLLSKLISTNFKVTA